MVFGAAGASDGRGRSGKSGVVVGGTDGGVVFLRLCALVAVALGMGDGGSFVVCVYFSGF